MGRTQLTTREIGSVQRNDFDTTTSGQAVITKAVAGTNISLSSTGADAGTGDVTISIPASPSLTGTPLSPTAAADTNTTQIATTAHVFAERSNTFTLTNKRITQRVGTTASSSTPAPTADSSDMYTITALAAGATFAAPSGTPTDGQALLIRIKDNGTARTLAWNAIYRAGTDFALPTTTVISKTIYVQFVYNAADSKWDAVGLTRGL